MGDGGRGDVAGNDARPRRIQRRRVKGWRMPEGAWAQGHRDEARCLSCGERTTKKPPAACDEERHAAYYDRRRERNNEYRRERRAEARKNGTVYTAGRGDMVRKAERDRQAHLDMRTRLFDRLGQHSCVSCGFAGSRALQLDHIDGGGRRHRRSLPSGSAYYRALAALTDVDLCATFQVLCANCNTIKREERQEWRWTRAEASAA